MIRNILKLHNMPRVQVLDMAGECSKKYLKNAKGDQGKIDLYGVTGIWKTFFRDMLLSKVHGNNELLVNRDYSDMLEKLSESYNADNLIESFFLIDNYQRDLLRNPNTGLMMVKMLLELKTLNQLS